MADDEKVIEETKGKKAKAQAPAGKPQTDEESIVQDPEPGAMDGALESLGASVAANEREALQGVDLSEEAHSLAIEGSERAASEFVLDTRSLVADARDFMLDQIKRRPKPWSATSNAEQRDVAAACEHAAQELVRKAVEAIAARGQEPVRVLLDKVNLGEAIQITGKVKTFSAEEEDKAVMLLHHARGKHVMLTVASKDDFQESHRDPETDPDQNELGFEAGDIDEEDETGD